MARLERRSFAPSLLRLRDRLPRIGAIRKFLVPGLIQTRYNPSSPTPINGDEFGLSLVDWRL